MRYFYLKFTNDDFTKVGQVWTTGSLNLYNNTQYKNYSAHKSKYGLNLIGNNTWTGLNDYGGGVTSAGFVDNDRFVDTTGRIDITRHKVDVISYPGITVDYEVNLYTSASDTETFPDNWDLKSGIKKGRNIYRIDSMEFARFEIVWTDDVDTSQLEIEYSVKIEIDEPVVNPLFERARGLLSVFPEWMAIREDSEESATPTLATPSTLGGSFLNAIAGEGLDDLRTSMLYLHSQAFLSRSDDSQKAWIYIVEGIPDYVYSVQGDGKELTRTTSAREFYDSTEDEDVCFFMDISNILWLNKDYTTITINGEEREASPIHVWNWFDEHGLLHDLERHHLESNDSFRKRILDVYINLPGVTLEGLKRTLRRELNLWLTYDSATPDSNHVGATPTIYELDELVELDEYFGRDGLPTEKMESLAYWMATTYPTTWGFFRWGQTLWDESGPDYKGYEVLPYQYDATPSTTLPIQPGVGDLDDLYLYGPDEIVLTADFEYKLRLKGLQRTVQTEYPEATFSVSIMGKADVETYQDRADAYLTLWVTANGTRYWSNIRLDSGLITSTTPIAGDRVRVGIDLIDDSGNLNTSLNWGVDGVAGEVYGIAEEDGTLVVALEDITEVAAQWGWDYDYSSTTPTNTSPAGYGTITFASDATPSSLNSNTVGTKVVANSTDAQLDLIAGWDNSSPVSDEFTTPKETVEINVNGKAPNNQKENFTLNPPTYTFPDGAIPGSEVWEVEIISLNEAGDPVAYTETYSGDPIELPSSSIELNGSAAWTSGKQEIVYDEDLQFEFEVTDSVDPAYPSNYDDWVSFTAESSTNYSATIDSEGAWFNGLPPTSGSNEDRLYFHEVTRDDFGLANTDDYMVTWIGVEPVGAVDATVYLSTNTVKPAENAGQLTYPDNAVVETYDQDLSKYVFSGFYVYGKKKERNNPQWNPFINSGWFYTSEGEFYLYADPKEESATPTTFELAEQNNLGAPIMIWDTATPSNQLRQTAFVEDFATPVLSAINTEHLNGTGSDRLYLAFEDVFDVEVTEVYTGTDVTLDVASASNEIQVSTVTDRDFEYIVKYKADKSFYVDNNFVNGDGNLVTKVFITDTASAGPYRIVYEGSDYNFATPIDVPLNPFYTFHDEGFVFLSHDEFDLSGVQVRLNPGTIASTTEDYVLVTVYASDEYGNPKPDQTFQASVDWGTLSDSEITTNADGYGFIVWTGEDNLVATEGTVTITQDGDMVGQATVDVGLVKTPKYTIAALPTADAIPADGESSVTIYGRVLDDGSLPVPYAVVSYKRGTSIRDLFEGSYAGQVVADGSGKFIIGPISSATPNDPGSVFYSVESWETGATPIGPVGSPNYGNPAEFGPVGDIVYWREYPSVLKFVNEFNDMPIDNEVYDSDNAYFMTTDTSYPVGYDEATPTQTATPNLTFDWEVPTWYHIAAYKQYQLGLRGNDYYTASYYDPESHPDYKEF